MRHILRAQQPAPLRGDRRPLPPTRDQRGDGDAGEHPGHVDEPERRLQPLHLRLLHQAVGAPVGLRLPDLAARPARLHPGPRRLGGRARRRARLPGLSGYWDCWGA